ncbi:MAG: DUF177 domain-containing protein [Lachnospiraceae bacterium]|nr:DUF177 domain-containing protein [Lachnospiraceae bacterium]
MFVNLTDVFTIEGKQVTMQAESELEQTTINGGVFLVKDKSPVNLSFTNIGKGKVRIAGDAKMIFGMNCDRCLKPVEEKITLQFDREVFAPDMAESIPDEIEDQDIMDGFQLNVEDLLISEIVMNWPMKVLCKPDCKGICRQCGKDLNTGTCDCDTFVPDPRMAVIKDIFNGNKEV